MPPKPIGRRTRRRAAAEREVPAGEFKAKCLALMDRVRETGATYVVTKHGRPVARLVPVDEAPPVRLFGLMAGTVLDYGDLISPIDEVWDADDQGDRGE